jgi:hypothetical protein
MAMKRFIIKHKLSEFYVPPSQEQLNVLNKVIHETVGRIVNEIQVEYLYTLSTRAHIIELSEDLNAEETRSFLFNVKKLDCIDYIEEDAKMYITNSLGDQVESSERSICLEWFDGCNDCIMGCCTEIYCYEDYEPSCISWSSFCPKECQRIVSGISFVCTC